jgi:uncharacterized RDD family membrane protein YckC
MNDIVGPTVAGRPVEVHVTGRRIVASIIDSLFIALLAGVLTGPVTVLVHGDADLPWVSGWSRAMSLFVAAVYYVVAEGLFGRTPGKHITGVRVIQMESGAVPGPGRAFLRTLLRLVDGLGGYLVGFIVVMVSRRRQRLGDMVAKTLVIRA